MGGATQGMAPLSAIGVGLSPRGRGNPRQAGPVPLPARSIPAWAGQPDHRTPRAFRSAVYPRVGGATARSRASRRLFFGLSPRGRGNRHARQPIQWRSGSIPAWAGQPSCPPETSVHLKVYPRVGGATDGDLPAPRDGDGLSPRGRGNPQQHQGQGSHSRSIPAWAGQPGHADQGFHGVPVYPRVGGATFGLTLLDGHGQGLSPRGRGNLFGWMGRKDRRRSIPAWAGQPTEMALKLSDE